MSLFNPFVMKKYSALIISPMISVIGFFIGVTFYNLWWGLLLLFVCLLLGTVVGNLLLGNPFTKLLEGKGILALNLDSTGVIRPFIVNVNPPYLFGKYFGRLVKDVFDRKTVLQFAVPKVAKKTAVKNKRGGLTIDMNEKEYNDGRFAFFHYPCVIWNSQINGLLTKDSLSNLEKECFAEHGILYLNRKMEELTGHIRDFGRHVVELTKPKVSIFQNKWTWIIILIVFVILGILFAPSIIQAIKGVSGSIAPGGLSGIGSAPITPR